MEIREVRPEEHQEAGRITAGAYREFARPGDQGWVRYLADIEDVAGRASRVPVLVAVEDGRILGTATLELDEPLGDDDVVLPEDAASLRMLGVDPSARGRGVGRALVEACVEMARAGGKRYMLLRTTPRMVAAQSLYSSMGFVRDPDRDLPIDDRLTLMAYRLPI